MSIQRWQARFSNALEHARTERTLKQLHVLESPMGPTATLRGYGDVVVLCSNNYLGLANDPRVLAGAAEGLRRYGNGTASVRFICGTLACHIELEESLAEFLGTEACLSYTSCWSANEGLIPAIASDGDWIVSDSTNHASIIDASRLARARRQIFDHGDYASLERVLAEIATSRADSESVIVVSDGVFSMEGDVARLDTLSECCRRHDAVLVIDDSHATGVLGPTGRGTIEHFHPEAFAKGGAIAERTGVHVLTSTLGKALGGGNGGFVAGSRELIDYLVQMSRPHLFSNALAPATACGAQAALDVLREEPERVGKLHDNVAKMRAGLSALGYALIDAPSAIIPIMVGDTAKAISLSGQLLELGVFVIGFGYPVVPEGEARLRVQVSAAHSDGHLDRALEAFSKVAQHAP